MKRGHKNVAEGNQTLGIVSPWNVITLQRLLHISDKAVLQGLQCLPMSPETDGNSEPVLEISMRKALQD